MNSRTTHANAILGPELGLKLPQTKVLLVGAGGIGCELLKNIVLTGFGHITLLDLDTIDLSNLNRQFLFKKKDVKQSKALVAAATAGAFNPNVKITPIHGNIKEEQFSVEWFKGFDIVLNALDNLEARRHVNKMCMAANIPLVESGTAGYLGQVQPLLKDQTECFDCIAKPTPKTFPVCTIRSTPSQPIHCIVWAKSYLIPQLFGEDENESAAAELDEAEKNGEGNANEIAALRKEALAFRAVRDALRSPTPNNDAAKLVFEKVYNKDIHNLLSMADMWRSRAPPTPLEFEGILDGSFILTNAPKPTNGNANGKATNGSKNAEASGSKKVESVLHPNGSAPASKASLKDQRQLTLKDNLELFISATARLSERLAAGEPTISFDKDDEDTLDFVCAASNLRGEAYGLGGKTKWEVKEMAGNIIPAIATTNAIVSGLIVLQALHLLRLNLKSKASPMKAPFKSPSKRKTNPHSDIDISALRNVHIQFKPSVPLSAITMCPPNPSCGICRDTYLSVKCDVGAVTLGEIISVVAGEREVSVYEDKRLLSDPDFDENLEKTLGSLSVTQGKFLSIVDEDGEVGVLGVAINNLPPNHPPNGPHLILPSPIPTPPRISKPPTAAVPSTPPRGTKRSAPDDDAIALSAPAGKKSKYNGNGTNGAGLENASPSKKRRLEEDGLVLMDNPSETLGEDDVIEID